MQLTTQADKEKPAGLAVSTSPHFPLSSPILEEISSPPGSASDDRGLERNRPFEFLKRDTGRKAHARRSASNEGSITMGETRLNKLYSTTTAANEDTDRVRQETGASDKPGLCIRDIMRKSIERPLGPSLITRMSSSPAKSTSPTAATYVDLGYLKQLSNMRERERSAQMFRKTFRRRTSRGFYRLPESQVESNTEQGHCKASPRTGLPPDYDGKEDTLKPHERTSITDESVPVTPSIVVTPAKKQEFWTESNLAINHPPPRRTSSVYSQPTPRLYEQDSPVPPVPVVPTYYSIIESEDNEDKRRLLDELSVEPLKTTKWKRKSSRSHADAEEDDCLDTKGNVSRKALRHLSINTDTDRRQSQGWWTYLLSPLSSHFESPKTAVSAEAPPVPSPSITNSERSSENWWDKEVSCFSPETPGTATVLTSIAEMSTDQEQKKSNYQTHSSDRLIGGHAVKGVEQTPNQPPLGMTPAMFPEPGMHGTAAEYYQACAHELFSKSPYFECVNHVCSITPDKEAIPKHSAIAKANGKKGLAGIAGAELGSHKGYPRNSAAEKGGSYDFRHGYRLETPATAMYHGTAPSAMTTEQQANMDGPSPPSLLDNNNNTTLFTGDRPIPKPSEPFFNNLAKSDSPNASAEYKGVAIPAPVAGSHVRYPYVANLQGPHYILVPSSNDEQWHWQFEPPNPTSPGLQQATEKRGFIPLSNIPSNTAVSTHEQTQQQNTEPTQVSTGPGGDSKSDSWPRVIQVPTMTQDIEHPAAVTTAKDDKAHCDRPSHFIRVPITITDPSPTDIERKRKGSHEHTHEKKEKKKDAGGTKSSNKRRCKCPFSGKGDSKGSGSNKRFKRRWYIVIASVFLFIIISAIALATTLSRKGSKKPGQPAQSEQSAWLNLTDFPPMPTGITTVAGPEPQVQNSNCIKPTSMWSCALPDEQQSANAPYGANQPNFKVDIRYRNSTQNKDSVSKASRDLDDTFDPSPSPPSMDEQTFLGNTTDNNTTPYAGEETPFFITFLSPVEASSKTKRLVQRDDASFPNLTALFPPPDIKPDGTAAAANLYPLPESQPIRLYNRGKSSEHYGFYTYFNRSIFLESSGPVNSSDRSDPPSDGNGGSSIKDARVRCTWAETRFLVQIWTQPNKTGMTLLSSKDSSNGDIGAKTESATATSPSSAATTTAGSSPASSPADDYTRPGSFPYPVTITLDRHGGAAHPKMVYCYGMDSNQHINGNEKKLQLEQRGFGGNRINPAPGIFNLSDDVSNSTWGGFDGGTGGCECQWTNWVTK